MKRQSKPAQPQPIEPQVVAPLSFEPVAVNRLYGIGQQNDESFDWYIDTTGVVFHTTNERLANIQCDMLNRHYGSSLRAKYVVKEIE